jgi:hypothetical protein
MLLFAIGLPDDVSAHPLKLGEFEDSNCCGDERSVCAACAGPALER